MHRGTFLLPLEADAKARATPREVLTHMLRALAGLHADKAY
jgi:hypothetical protein